MANLLLSVLSKKPTPPPVEADEELDFEAEAASPIEVASETMPLTPVEEIDQLHKKFVGIQQAIQAKPGVDEVRRLAESGKPVLESWRDKILAYRVSGDPETSARIVAAYEAVVKRKLPPVLPTVATVAVEPAVAPKPKPPAMPSMASLQATIERTRMAEQAKAEAALAQATEPETPVVNQAEDDMLLQEMEQALQAEALKAAAVQQEPVIPAIQLEPAKVVEQNKAPDKAPAKKATPKIVVAPPSEPTPASGAEGVLAQIKLCKEAFLQFRAALKQNPPNDVDTRRAALERGNALITAWRDQVLALRPIGNSDAVVAAEQEFTSTTTKELPPEELPVTINRLKLEYLAWREENRRKPPTSLDWDARGTRGNNIFSRWQAAVEAYRANGITSRAIYYAVDEFQTITKKTLDPLPGSEPAPSMSLEPQQEAAVPVVQTAVELPKPVVTDTPAPAPRKFMGMRLPGFMQPKGVVSTPASKEVEKREPEKRVAVDATPPAPIVSVPAETTARSFPDLSQAAVDVPEAPVVIKELVAMDIHQAINSFVDSLRPGNRGPGSNPAYTIVEHAFRGNEHLSLENRIAIAERVLEEITSHVDYAQIPVSIAYKRQRLHGVRQGLYNELIAQEVVNCQNAFNGPASTGGLAYLTVLPQWERRLLNFISADAMEDLPVAPAREILRMSLCQTTDVTCKGEQLLPILGALRNAYLQPGEGSAEELAAKQRKIAFQWQGYLQVYRLLGIPQYVAQLEADFVKITQQKIMPLMPFEVAVVHAQPQRALPQQDTRAEMAPAPSIQVVEPVRIVDEPANEAVAIVSKRMSYIECMLGSVKIDEGTEWFAKLPKGVQYRLYDSICSDKTGLFEDLLRHLQGKGPGMMYNAVFSRNGRTPSVRAPLNAEFMRNKLFESFVQKRLDQYPSAEKGIMNSIHTLVLIYSSVNREEVLDARMKRIDAKTVKFLSQNEEFLRYVEQQAVALGNKVDARWAKEHFLDNAWIFFEALTRWYDLQPMKEDAKHS